MKAAAKSLGWPLPEEFSDAQLEEVLFPRAPGSSEREVPDFAGVHEELRRHRELTLLQLWVEYAEDNPRAYRYSRYCELYQRWRKKLNPMMRQRHQAGEKTFVDFSGKRPHIVDPKTGELQPVELFVAALGASNYMYAEATEDQSIESWVKAHEGMATYFKGSSEIWVPDNLKSGVDWADRYEPGINRTYKELSSHYGAVVIPARVAKPKDKAKVESAVQVAQRWILAVVPSIYSSARTELDEYPVCRHHACMISSLVRALISAFKARRELALENVALRQQLAVLRRSVKRPRLSNVDRRFWVLLRRIWTDWESVLST